MTPRKAKISEKAAEKHEKRDKKPPSRHGSSTAMKTNGDADDNGGWVAAGADSDCLSITGSCSGESEDQTHKNSKEKQEPRGCVSTGAVSQKREKIRWKNEKKHVRQKERRAKDLKDRSIGYLMSRKLQVLSDQLVCMGFPADRATMALITHQGQVEKSVAWLLEGGDDPSKEGGLSKNNGDLKLDISEELSRMADLEITCKYPRIEVERAVVTCEGDLEKAAEWLRDHHPIVQESPADSGKLDPPPPPLEGSMNLTKPDHQRGSNQRKSLPSPVANEPSGNETIPQTQATGALPRNIAAGAVEGIKPSPPPQAVRAKSQRQTSQAAPIPIISSLNLPTNCRPFYQIKTPADNKLSGPKSSALYGGCLTSEASSMAPQLEKKPHSVLSSPPAAAPHLEEPGLVSKDLVSVEPGLSEVGRSNLAPSMMVKYLQHSNQSRTTFSPPGSLFPPANSEPPSAHLSKPAQLSPEIFAGWGFVASGGYADWTMGAMPNCDYRTIDWSMPHSPSSSPGRPWGIPKGLPTTPITRQWFQHGQGVTDDLSSHRQTSAFCSSLSRDVGDKYGIWGDTESAGNTKALGSHEIDSSHTSLEEWTSPFAGKDLFMFPHQAVSFPTL